MMAALRPDILEQRALPEALGQVCEQWSSRTGIESKLSITGTPAPLHPEIELAILRACRRVDQRRAPLGCAHYGRHTQLHRDLIVLDVQDDGKGFVPTAAARRSSYGLTGMRERAEGLQARSWWRACRAKGRRSASPCRCSVPSRRHQGRGGRLVSIRIVIADDHPIFRAGLQGLLSAQEDFEVVGRPPTARRR